MTSKEKNWEDIWVTTRDFFRLAGKLHKMNASSWRDCRILRETCTAMLCLAYQLEALHDKAEGGDIEEIDLSPSNRAGVYRPGTSPKKPKGVKPFIQHVDPQW